MGVSLTDYVQSLRNLRQDLIESRPQEALRMANDTYALAKRRIINGGEKADGSRFGRYSEAVVPYWYYRGKETNRDNAAAVRDLLDRFGYFASYKDWRQVNNLPTDKINLSFTNSMWKNTRGFVVETGEDYVIISIHASNRKDQDKLNYLSGRFGNLLALNEEEQEYLRKANEARFRKKIEKHLGGFL